MCTLCVVHRVCGDSLCPLCVVHRVCGGSPCPLCVVHRVCGGSLCVLCVMCRGFDDDSLCVLCVLRSRLMMTHCVRSVCLQRARQRRRASGRGPTGRVRKEVRD